MYSFIVHTHKQQFQMTNTMKFYNSFGNLLKNNISTKIIYIFISIFGLEKLPTSLM